MTDLTDERLARLTELVAIAGQGIGWGGDPDYFDLAAALRELQRRRAGADKQTMGNPSGQQAGEVPSWTGTSWPVGLPARAKLALTANTAIGAGDLRDEEFWTWYADHLSTVRECLSIMAGAGEPVAQYLKDGETVAECIARNRADVASMMGLLAKEKLRVAILTGTGNRLSFAAQTSGGIAGRDAGLLAAIEEWTRTVIAHPPAAPDAEREECARQCEAAGHDERLADGGLYLRAARLLRAPDADRRDAERLDFILDWLGMNDNELPVRDWNDNADARQAIDEAIDAAKAGGRG